MSYPIENESACFNTAEMTLTESLGRILPDLANLTRLRRALDVGCGTGGWLIELARTHPTIYTHLGLDQRVWFLIMDAPCSPASFDSVNQRLGATLIRHREWHKIFREYQRVTRLGGTIHITEADIIESNSPALTKLCHLYSARFFDLCRDGITSKLVPLMTTHGLQDIQARHYTLIFQAGTSEHQSFVEDMRHFFHVALPSDYDEMYQQALSEMQQPDFLASWKLHTFCGKRQSK